MSGGWSRNAWLAAPVILLTASGCAPQAQTVPPTRVPVTATTPPTIAAVTATPALAAAPAPSLILPVAATPAVAVPAPATPAPVGAPAAQAVGMPASALGEKGKAVYETNCQACHGKEGQGVIGPAVWGPRASPAKYGGTAANWNGYIRQTMPQNSPGSLTADEYLQVTTYLLLQNNLVQPGQPVSEPGLAQIKTEK